VSERRKLGAMRHLPEYPTAAMRVATLDHDVREAASEARKSIIDTMAAKGYTARGFSVDDESWEIAVAGDVVIATVSIERPN
jgi:hypothetical protein